MNNEVKLKNFNEEGLRLKNKKKLLLEKLFLLELQKEKEEALKEFELKHNRK